MLVGMQSGIPDFRTGTQKAEETNECPVGLVTGEQEQHDECCNSLFFVTKLDL
jgi:hypothetical protein